MLTGIRVCGLPLQAVRSGEVSHNLHTRRPVNRACVCPALRQAIVEARGGADGDLPLGADPLSPALARAPSGASALPPSPPPLLFQYQRPPSGAAYGVRYAASSPRPGGGGDASGVSSRSHSKRTSYSGAAVSAVAAALAGGDRASRGSLPGLEEGGQGVGESYGAPSELLAGVCIARARGRAQLRDPPDMQPPALHWPTSVLQLHNRQLHSCLQHPQHTGPRAQRSPCAPIA